MTIEEHIENLKAIASDMPSDKCSDWIESLMTGINAMKELQAHRYAWAKLREDIRDEVEFAYADFDEYKYEVLGIDDVDDLPNDDYRYGMERALELIDIYRPKEGDAK